jgi:hypothetical protein
MLTKNEIRSRLAFIRTEVNPEELRKAYVHLSDLIDELTKEVNAEYEQKRIVNQAIRDLQFIRPDIQDKEGNYSYLDK